MTRALSHEDDLNHAVGDTRLILQLIGAWPLSSSSSTFERILKKLLIVTCYFLFLFILVPGFLRIFLKETNIRVRLKLFGPLYNTALSLLKYSFILYRVEDIKRGLEEMRIDWTNTVDREEREIMLSKTKIVRKLLVFSVVLMYGGGLSYRTIVPLSKGPIVTPENVTIRPLACPSYFIKFDEQISPAYEIVFVVQFFAGFSVYSVTCGVCGLSAFLVIHVCGQLRLLINKINRLTTGKVENERNVARQIADIVEHHTRAKGFLKQAEKIIEYMCLVEIIGCTSLVCLVGYYVIMEWERSDATAMLTYVMLTVSFAFSIFIFCYIGQLLSDESNEVQLTLATLDWYRLPTRKARSLVLIIAVSNNTMEITAGKMMQMSLKTFTSVMKTSVGYFNILRTIVT